MDEQSAPVLLHFLSVEHCAADVQDVPVLLQVPAIVGQLVAALAAVHEAPVLTLHLPMSVQTDALFGAVELWKCCTSCCTAGPACS